MLEFRFFVVYSAYKNYSHSSLVLGKFKNIVGYNGRDDQYALFVEFEVTEDYYGKLKEGTTFLVKIRLDDLSEKDVRQLLDTNDQFIYYIHYDPYTEDYIDINTNEIIHSHDIAGRANFDLHSLIPIQNGKINIKELDQMMIEYEDSYIPFEKISCFDKYITHGMSVDEAGNNLKELYQWLVETDGWGFIRDPNVDY